MPPDLVLLTRVAFRGREITSPRLRCLLAVLAGDLRAGASTTRLVDRLWPDEQPERPAKALQVLVSRARVQLGAAVIATTPAGYRLRLTEQQVDSYAVLLHASASARHSRTGDQAGALAHAEAGLALWGGAAVEDDAADDPVSVLRSDLVSTYRALVRARGLALARLGRHEAMQALTTLQRDQPRDEEILLELLRCEATTHGPSAALARYEAYRRGLRDELGGDPGPGLQALHRQLLDGSGWEATRALHAVPHEPNPLLGRDDDIAAVTELVASSRVTSIVGPGGLGKTRLAHAVCHRAEHRIVHVVALAGVTSDDDVPAEVASALGVATPDPPQRGTPTSSPASSPRSAVARRCWCWTTASTSSRASPIWCASWSR